ncbi:MAG: ferritin family protein [Dehalococcoidia bacterium]|nr:ferritin family protein [Dehalococcoidia bacterium]
MPEFVDPFRGNLPDRKLTLGELIRAIRLDVAAEEEATHLYVAQAEATDNELAKKVLLDIADEERVHVGEFMRLLSILTEGEEDRLLAEGASEVNEMAAGISPAEEAAAAEAGKEAAGEGFTVGSLRD